MSHSEGRTAEDLVADFVHPDRRVEALEALHAIGAAALPAIREGLRHGNWQVRKWCAIALDHLADDESIRALVPLLRDPKADVRLWAVHSVSCETCKVGENPVDTVPLLLERIELDESIRVRRMAVAMLWFVCAAPDVRVVPCLKRILAEEEDRKLRLHAQRALERFAQEGLRP